MDGSTLKFNMVWLVCLNCKAAVLKLFIKRSEVLSVEDAGPVLSRQGGDRSLCFLMFDNNNPCPLCSGSCVGKGSLDQLKERKIYTVFCWVTHNVLPIFEKHFPVHSF